MIVQVEEKFLVSNYFPAPGNAVPALELLEFLLWKIQSIPGKVLVARLPAKGRLLAQGPAASALHDPFRTRMFSPKPGLEKFTVLPLAAPVDMKNARGLAQ